MEVRRDVLDEENGPMLLRGLQGMHETSILVPRKAVAKPDPALLERRYEDFRSAPESSRRSSAEIRASSLT